MAFSVTALCGVSIERLRSFCLIVEAGSVVAAANRNPVKQSLLSRQMRDLERALGTKLFRREGKHLSLTTDGVRLAALTNAYFSALGDFGEGEGGRLRPIRLGGTESVVRWMLAPRFPEMLTAAGAPLDVQTQRTTDTVEKLEAGQLDVGIVRADAVTDPLESLPFSRMRFVLMAPRSKLPGKSADGIHATSTLPFVTLTGDGRFVRQVERIVARNKLSLRIAARVQSFSLAIELAEVLDAATFVPVVAQGELSSEQFAPTAIDGIEELDRPLVVVYSRRTVAVDPRARRFAMRVSRSFETTSSVGDRL